MECLDCFEITLKNGKKYENYLDHNGYVYEELDNVALGDGCYCKHFSYKRDWDDKSSYNADGFPALQCHCSLINKFLGGFCCSGGCHDFEKGKSARVKTIKDKVSKDREKRNIPERGSGLITYSQKHKKSMSGRDYVRYMRNIDIIQRMNIEELAAYLSTFGTCHKCAFGTENGDGSCFQTKQLSDMPDCEEGLRKYLEANAED